MNTSTRARSKGLLQHDKKIAFDTFVEQQAIKYKFVMDTACLEAGDKSAVETVITAIIDNQDGARATTAKRHKTTVPEVTPTKTNNQPISDNRKKAGKSLFPTTHAFINKPTDNKSDNEYVEEDYTNDKTIPTVATSNKVNGTAGAYTLTIAQTYKE